MLNFDAGATMNSIAFARILQAILFQLLQSALAEARKLFEAYWHVVGCQSGRFDVTSFRSKDSQWRFA